MSGLEPALVAAAYEAACLAELKACKPGNVHVHAGGHRMSVADFERSAAASAGPLAERDASVGRRVLGAVTATLQAVGTNTNLGIVLLCAPLAAAAERGGDLFSGLAHVLGRLDRADAACVFDAIRIASPAGLGSVAEHDVRSPPEVDLLAAMRAPAGRDRIARAYATDFADLVAVGLPALDAARRDGLTADWAATAVYLAFLAAFPDTHIARKHGPAAAERVRRQAEALRRSISLDAEPLEPLLRFDRMLKERGLNPGTSADFTVATLFASALNSSLREHRRLVGR